MTGPVRAIAIFVAAAAPVAARTEPPPRREPLHLADLPPEVPAGGRAARIAVLPPQNLTGLAIDAADLASLTATTETALARAGLEVVSGDPVDRFLARLRIRTTGGLDRELALAARDELDVRGALVTTILQRSPGDSPRLALLLRLVSTDGNSTLYWIDGLARAGGDHPGLLGLGVIHRVEVLEREALDRLARSLAKFLDGRGPVATPCAGGRRYRPTVAFRNFAPAADLAFTVAVLPFLNRTGRDDAGEVAALELLRQLAARGQFVILEPGVVQAELLRRRILIPGGVSLDTARMMLGSLEVDYVVAGTVDRYDEGGTPQVDFSVTMLDARTGLVAWQSTSRARGNDGVVLFDWGKINTASELTCRLMREVADGMAGNAPRRTGSQASHRPAAAPIARDPRPPWLGRRDDGCLDDSTGSGPAVPASRFMRRTDSRLTRSKRNRRRRTARGLK